jgi:hypothetical protein
VIAGAACDIASILAHYPRQVRNHRYAMRNRGPSPETAAVQSTQMFAPRKPANQPRWYLIPVRVLILTFLLTLLSFAVSLLLGILTLVIASRLQNLHPNLTTAYLHIALPIAVATAAIVLIAASALEIRRYRQTKTLAEIERISR